LQEIGSATPTLLALIGSRSEKPCIAGAAEEDKEPVKRERLTYLAASVGKKEVGSLQHVRRQSFREES
jgi:hypothetical protein